MNSPTINNEHFTNYVFMFTIQRIRKKTRDYMRESSLKLNCIQCILERINTTISIKPIHYNIHLFFCLQHIPKLFFSNNGNWFTQRKWNPGSYIDKPLIWTEKRNKVTSAWNQKQELKILYQCNICPIVGATWYKWTIKYECFLKLHIFPALKLKIIIGI